VATDKGQANSLQAADGRSGNTDFLAADGGQANGLQAAARRSGNTDF
jgi:hypothetical protein